MQSSHSSNIVGGIIQCEKGEGRLNKGCKSINSNLLSLSIIIINRREKYLLYSAGVVIYLGALVWFLACWLATLSCQLLVSAHISIKVSLCQVAVSHDAQHMTLKGFIHSWILFNDNAVVNSWRLFLILKCFVCYLDGNCNHCPDLDICIFNDKQFKAFQYQRQMLWYVLLFWNWLYGPEIKWLLGLVAQHQCHYMTRVEPVWQQVIFQRGRGFSLLSLRICIVFVMKKEARLLWNCGKKCYRYLTALSPRCRLFIS